MQLNDNEILLLSELLIKCLKQDIEEKIKLKKYRLVLLNLKI